MSKATYNRNEYAGTVSVVAPLQIGTFTLSAASTGAIAQPSSWAGNDITVTDAFTWTSGTLNNSANVATVNVNGGGSITPFNAGTLMFGSTLVFNGTQGAPKETVINPGTIALTAGAGGLVVGAYATLTANTSTSGDIIGINKNLAGAQAIDILANGVLNCIGPGQITYDIYIRNRGRLNLVGSVRVNLTGVIAGLPAGSTPTNYGQTETGGLGIQNGSVLTASQGLDVTGGLIYLTMNANFPANQQTATVSGNLFMSGGTILFSAPIGIGTTPFVYGTFTVNGNVNWTGGTFKPSVDYTSVGLANKWVVTGILTSAATAKIEPNPQRGPNRPASSVWQILETGTLGGDPASVVGGSGLRLAESTVGGHKIWSLESPM